MIKGEKMSKEEEKRNKKEEAKKILVLLQPQLIKCYSFSYSADNKD